MVPQEGLEPPLLSKADFESAASTDSTTGAQNKEDIFSVVCPKLRTTFIDRLSSRYGLAWDAYTHMVPHAIGFV
jgi:hypothetical protein